MLCCNGYLPPQDVIEMDLQLHNGSAVMTRDCPQAACDCLLSHTRRVGCTSGSLPPTPATERFKSIAFAYNSRSRDVPGVWRSLLSHQGSAVSVAVAPAWRYDAWFRPHEGFGFKGDICLGASHDHEASAVTQSRWAENPDRDCFKLRRIRL